MFTKSNKHNDTPPAPEPAKVQPSVDAIRGAASKPAARAASIICADMKINGSVTSEGALQIDGTVDGDVAATDITIGASGHITGEVKAEVVKVKGRIKGSIRARKVELETGAFAQGRLAGLTLSGRAVQGVKVDAPDPAAAGELYPERIRVRAFALAVEAREGQRPAGRAQAERCEYCGLTEQVPGRQSEDSSEGRKCYQRMPFSEVVEGRHHDVVCEDEANNGQREHHALVVIAVRAQLEDEHLLGAHVDRRRRAREGELGDVEAHGEAREEGRAQLVAPQ